MGKKIIKTRAILSSLILLNFIIILFTGIGLYLAPSGSIAKGVGWNFLGFDKWQLGNLHTIFGFIMSVLVIIHLIINYKLFISEIKSLFQKT